MMTSRRVIEINNIFERVIRNCLSKAKLDSLLTPLLVDDYLVGYAAARRDVIWAERVTWENKQYVWKSDLSRVFVTTKI